MWYVNSVLRYDSAKTTHSFPQDVPVLLLGGKHTANAVVRTIEELAADLPSNVDVETHWIAGGHLAVFRKPTQIVTIIGDWLKQVK